MLPLEGTRVLTFEHAVAAPFCTRQLADLGARVIKVERPGGGDFARAYDERVRGQSSHFVWTNRSKESLTLNLKSAEAAKVVHALLGETDILVQNLAPGAASRLGLDPAALGEKYPRLIVCDISGYGRGGPYEDKKAYDLLIQSEAGFLSATGNESGPAKAGCSIADIAAGMHALTNILAALIERANTGRGRHIDISMLESMTEWMGHPLYYAFEGQAPLRPMGASHATIVPYGPFETGDGKSTIFAVQNEREWKRFCEQVLQAPHLAGDSRFANNTLRTEHRGALCEIVDQALSVLTRDELIARLDAAGIANAHLNDMKGVWEHPQLEARDRWRKVATPSGEIPALLPPGISPGEPCRMDPVPALGQHTDALLAEIGYGPDAIAHMRTAGIV